MSNSVASESTPNYGTRETNRIRDGDDEGDEDIDEIMDSSSTVNSTTMTTTNNNPPASAAPAAVEDFLVTVDFKRLLVTFVPDDTLMTLRLATKAWKVVAEEVIDEGVESGELMVQGGNKCRLFCSCWSKREA